jgi:tetratricopeptide (TPR) repeat protein
VPKTKFDTLREIALDNIEANQFEAAFLHLHKALKEASRRAQFRALSKQLTHTPKGLLESPKWLELHIETAYKAGLHGIVAQLLTRVSAQEQFAYRAFVSITEGRYEQGLRYASQESDHPVALRYRARATAHLGDPAWSTTYNQVLERLQGREQGLSWLEYGYFLTMKGDQASARQANANALHLLSCDPFYESMAAGNLGMNCLQLDLLDDANRHLKRAWKAAHKPDGESNRIRAWISLGHLRRTQGQFPRAEHAYQQAIDLLSTENEQDASDLRDLHRGYGHLHRLMNQADEALEHFVKAIQTLPADHQTHGLYADMAAAKVQITLLDDAEKDLGRAPKGHSEDAQRAALVRAEIARQRHRIQESLEWLGHVEPSKLCAREEAPVFPELFALRDERVNAPSQMRILIDMNGPVRISIRGERIDLKADSLEVLLLCYLVLHGSTRKSVLIEELELDQSRHLRLKTDAEKNHQYAKVLNRIYRNIGDKFFWKNAILKDNEIYALNPQAIWESALPSPDQADAFCDGFSHDWVNTERDTLKKRT